MKVKLHKLSVLGINNIILLLSPPTFGIQKADYSQFKYLITVLVICLSLGCSQSSYQTRHKTITGEETKESVKGAYTMLRATSSDSVFIGELIFIEDSIYFLIGMNQLSTYAIDEIVTLKVQLSRFGERSYLTLMAIAIPSLLSQLSKSKEVNTLGAAGLIVVGPGLLFSLVENAKQPHFISYPEEPIEAFKKYARYPIELPKDFMGQPTKFSTPVAIRSYTKN